MSSYRKITQQKKARFQKRAIKDNYLIIKLVLLLVKRVEITFLRPSEAYRVKYRTT